MGKRIGGRVVVVGEEKNLPLAASLQLVGGELEA